MASRRHRFPEQKEGLGYHLLLDLDLCSISKWEAVSFKNISRHSLEASLELKDSGDGSYVSPVSHTQSQQVWPKV